jgi:hypothetical protein
MRAKVFVEVAAPDISMPLVLVLDGDAAILPTVMAIDFT